MNKPHSAPVVTALRGLMTDHRPVVIMDAVKDIGAYEAFLVLRSKLPGLTRVSFDADWEIDDSGRQYVAISGHDLVFADGTEVHLGSDPHDCYVCGMGDDEEDVKLAHQGGLITLEQKTAWLDDESDQAIPDEISGYNELLEEVTEQLYQLRDLVEPSDGETPVVYASLRERLGITD